MLVIFLSDLPGHLKSTYTLTNGYRKRYILNLNSLKWNIKSVTKPDGWDFRNKEMQILKRELQMLCDEEKEMAREKTARQQLVIR